MSGAGSLDVGCCPNLPWETQPGDPLGTFPLHVPRRVGAEQRGANSAGFCPQTTHCRTHPATSEEAELEAVTGVPSSSYLKHNTLKIGHGRNNYRQHGKPQASRTDGALSLLFIVKRTRTAGEGLARNLGVRSRVAQTGYEGKVRLSPFGLCSDTHQWPKGLYSALPCGSTSLSKLAFLVAISYLARVSDSVCLYGSGINFKKYI